MIAINKLSMAYGDRLLYFDVNLNLLKGKSYALVGANGSGKSTLFRLINRTEEASSGEVQVPKEATIGWLKQDQFRYENDSIKSVVLQGDKKLWQAFERKEKLLLTEEWTDAVVNKLANVEEEIAHLDGYSAESRAENILVGLGITESYHQKPLKLLSGGYKLRVLLAQTLFQNPSILLLDEPTNHLDILSIRWLEKFLRNEFKGLVLFISHDLSFISGVCDHILDIDYGEIRQYGKSYDKFLADKALMIEQLQAEKRNLESKISHMQQFVDKFRAKASKARQAQSKLKQIEKIKLPDIKQSSRIAPSFRFKQNRPSGKDVLQVKELCKAYGEKSLIEFLALSAVRGEKLAIMGANGIGKSTLMKMLVGQLAPDLGEVNWGYETHLAYFSQDHHELLNESQTALNWLRHETVDHDDQAVRKALAAMLFVKDDVDKDILTLSGGECARLLLARLMLAHANVLLLDEPTNHMDLETIEALGLALKHYDGTLLVVSHDRTFVRAVANRILFVCSDHQVIDHPGDYDSFMQKYGDKL